MEGLSVKQFKDFGANVAQLMILLYHMYELHTVYISCIFPQVFQIKSRLLCTLQTTTTYFAHFLSTKNIFSASMVSLLCHVKNEKRTDLPPCTRVCTIWHCSRKTEKSTEAVWYLVKSDDEYIPGGGVKSAQCSACFVFSGQNYGHFVSILGLSWSGHSHCCTISI